MPTPLRQDIGMALDRHFDSPEEVDENTPDGILDMVTMVENQWIEKRKKQF